MTKRHVFTDVPGRFKSHLLSDELKYALGWNSTTAEGTTTLQSKPDGSQVEIFADDDTDENLIIDIVNNHDPDVLSISEVKQRGIDDSVDGFKTIPDWATWTPDEAEQYVQGNVLSGFDQAQLDTWIDTNVTNLEEAKDALKLIGGAIIDLRNIASKIAKMIMWLRNIIIR